MAQVCPTCNSALDPTHAPVARVRASKVVTYCSVDCANQSDTGAVAAPSSAQVAKPALATPRPAAKTGSEGAVAKARKPAPSEASAVKVKPAGDKRKPSEAVPMAIARDSSVPKTAQDSQTSRGSGRRTIVLAVCGAAMLGGIAIAVMQLSRNRSAATQDAQKPATPNGKPTDATHEQSDADPGAAKDTAALPTPAVLRSAAVKELESHLGTGAPRFQRLAGIALARIKHPGAVASLTTLLGTEDSDLSRIDIAYGMALGGQASGREYLVNELKSTRRDVRIDAARRLVQLGDDAGRKTLVQMLNVKSHRLGAASVLALLADEQGLEVLRKTLTEADASEENRMRAAVGLGRAGDENARTLLLEILREGRYVVDAAGALATLGEPEAVPALERQLELTAMRVVAAESLQAMGASVDLTLLASALIHDNEEGRIAAAEAILVLTAAETSK